MLKFFRSKIKSLDIDTGVIEKHLNPGQKISNVKRAIMLGLLYHGYGPKVWNPNGPLTRAINNSFYNGNDQEFIDSVYNLYNSSEYKERAK